MPTRLSLAVILACALVLTGCAAGAANDAAVSAAPAANDAAACDQVYEILDAATAALSAEPGGEANLDRSAEKAAELLDVDASPDFTEQIVILHDAFQAAIEALREGLLADDMSVTAEEDAALTEAAAQVTKACE